MNNPHKYKRGKQFIVIDTGELLTLDRVQESGDYFCLKENGTFDVYSPDEVKDTVKHRTPINSTPKPKSNDEKEKSDKLTQFFESLTIPNACHECDKQLIAFTPYGRRSVSAHVLPKSKFESIAMNPDNILFLGAGYLGGCNCHDIYDSCVDSRKSMKVYHIALKRYETMLPLLTDKEINEANKYLGL